MSEKAPQFDIMAETARRADIQHQRFDTVMEGQGSVDPNLTPEQNAQGYNDFKNYLESHAYEDVKGKLHGPNGNFTSHEDAAATYRSETPPEDGEGPKEVTDMSVSELVKESMNAERNKHEKAREYIDGVLKSKIMVDAEKMGLSTEPRVDTSSKDKDAMKPSLAEEYVNKTIAAARKKQELLENPVVDAPNVVDTVEPIADDNNDDKDAAPDVDAVEPDDSEALNDDVEASDDDAETPNSDAEVSDDQNEEANDDKDSDDDTKKNKLSGFSDLPVAKLAEIAAKAKHFDDKDTLNAINKEVTDRINKMLVDAGLDPNKLTRATLPAEVRAFVDSYQDALDKNVQDLELGPLTDDMHEAALAENDQWDIDHPKTRAGRLKRIARAMTPRGIAARMQSRSAENGDDNEKNPKRRKVAAVVGVAALAALGYWVATKGGDAGTITPVEGPKNPNAGADAAEQLHGSYTMKAGDTIWDRVRDTLEAASGDKQVTNAQVDLVTDEILKRNGLTEEEARHLAVGTKIKY